VLLQVQHVLLLRKRAYQLIDQASVHFALSDQLSIKSVVPDLLFVEPRNGLVPIQTQILIALMQ
jgi:hypothetical protein